MPYKSVEKQREAQRKHYRQNKDYYRKRNSRRREALKQYILSVKLDIPCSDCGINYPPYVMDFDHVRGKKFFNIAHAATLKVSIKRLKEELAKCELVCSNCHRIRTHS